MLQKRDLTNSDGKVHSIICYMEETYKRKSSYNQARMIYTETRDAKPSMLTVLLHFFVGFLERFLVQLRLYLLWSLYQTTAGFGKWLSASTTAGASLTLSHSPVHL